MRAARRTLSGPLVRRAAPVCCCPSPVCVSSPHLHAAFDASVPLATSARTYTTLTRSLRQSWKKLAVRRWMCVKPECHTVNRPGSATCEACGTKKPMLVGWKCVECSTMNFGGVKKCKSCGELAEKSKDFWMCAVCHENNRVDEMEDNSRCGHCGYDMAPPSKAEETILERAREVSATMQQQQQGFDSVSYEEADQQFSNPLEGAEALEPALRTRYPAAPIGRSLKMPLVKPFVAAEVSTSRSPLRRGPGRVHHAVEAVRKAAAGLIGPPGFDWICRNSECGHINSGDEEACTKCGAKLIPTEWECPRCAAMNHLTRSRCFNCRSSIPVCWTCGACHSNTSIYDRACRSCGADRPLAEPKTFGAVERDTSGTGKFVAQGNRDRGDWYCPSCSAMNFSRRTDCFQCSTPRPRAGEGAEAADQFAPSGWGDAGAADAAAQNQSKTQDNNWICTRCEASNFRTRHDCWKCGNASDRQQEWASEAAAPHFEREGFQSGGSTKSAEGQMNQSHRVQGEWVCAKCYTKNFKHRTECFRCGSRKVVVSPTRSGARKPVKL